MTAVAPPSPPPPKKRWFRRAPAPVATSTVCIACGQQGQIKLLPGEPCASCKSQQAWSANSAEPLRIDHATIDAAVKRRAGEAAGLPLWRRAIAWWPLVLTLGLAVLAASELRTLLSARDLGPLRTLIAELQASARRTTLFGLLALIVGVVALVRLRKHRNFRRVPLIVSHALAIIAGAAALVLGGLHWWGTGGFGGAYTSMPPRVALPVSSTVDRILAATVVVLAPDKDGDARGLAMGTGAIIAADPARAWVVTCSHVAMPYAAVGAARHAKDAHPVWVQLSDGREGKARVRWAAPPPLDVVLIELPIADPPAPVVIAPDAAALTEGSKVTFVPNPYRDGWLVHDGQLLRRERHDTPAGSYELLYTDLPVVPGDSGSGLFDARGQLVGLNTWTRMRPGLAAEGISLPSDTMRALVDAIAAGRIDQLDDATPLTPAAERP
ncbi:MAG: trypsin-like peptidase domain-containing protein [Myxococcales bacterium]|nr:trypsin-like peptidase domain-containing protein [Myxococcales bacterium]